MLQVIVRRGKVVTEETPAPHVSDQSVLIKVAYSCISAGTEIGFIKSTGKSYIQRALDQPKDIQKLLNMAKSEGIVNTYQKVKAKFESGNPTGYSISGVVIAVGQRVTQFKTGDRVAAAGAGLANHAEYVDVPENLVMKTPNNMNLKDAATVTLGGIAMQGVRRANLQLGEFCAIVGSGILGLLSLQMLRLSGVRVAVIDVDESRLEIAKAYGAELTLNPLKDEVVKTILNWSNGYGVDSVLFTAATESSEPLSQGFQICKKKGRLVLVGVSGMEINREDIYTKELDFLVSCSYGPGRYDKNYEEKGLDYPYAYIRWTENRNMTEYLRLLHSGSINLDYLIDQTYPIEKASEAFASLTLSEKKPLMVLLEYAQANPLQFNEYLAHSRKIILSHEPVDKQVINVAVIGAGEFVDSVHLPNIANLKNQFALHAIMSRTGHKAKSFAKKYNAKYTTTSYEDVLTDQDIDLVLISTGHESHAKLALQALKAGKHVFVEKPLATTPEDLAEIQQFYESEGKLKPLLFVGFNRRFSPYICEIRKHTDKRINPMLIRYRINAGHLPSDHWVHEHGGRMVGELCHFIDLVSSLTQCKIEKAGAESIDFKTDFFRSDDNKSIFLKYSDGSVACLEYFSIGNSDLSKESMEVHFDGKSIVLDDFKTLKGYGVKLNEMKTKTSQKGHYEELVQLHLAIKNGGKWPIDLWDLIQTTKISMQL